MGGRAAWGGGGGGGQMTDVLQPILTMGAGSDLNPKIFNFPSL